MDFDAIASRMYGNKTMKDYDAEMLARGDNKSTSGVGSISLQNKKALLPQRPPYRLPKGKKVPDKISEALGKMGREYQRITGRVMKINSLYRDASQQAQAMFNNREAGKTFSIYRNREVAVAVEKAYQSGKEKGLSNHMIVAEMAAIIQDNFDKGEIISRHMVESAVDINTDGIDAKQVGAIIKAAKSVGAMAKDEGDHVHVQF